MGGPPRALLTTQRPGEVRNRGVDCHAECGGAEGSCPGFCGNAGACCRRGFVDAESDPACENGVFGCDLAHCCVRAAEAS